MASLNGLVLSLVFTAIFFYVLYFVVRAAVRDGMRQALPASRVEAPTSASYDDPPTARPSAADS